MSKPKKILFVAVFSLIGYIIFVNMLEQTTLRYLPFVDPIEKVPVLLVVLISFGAGVLASVFYRWWRALKNKGEKTT